MYTSVAEVFSLGIKAGLDAETLWQTIRKGLNGRRPMFDCVARNFLPSNYDDADFSLALATKDCRLALELSEEHGVPMRMAEEAYAELNAAMDRGWAARDARAYMLLQLERAGLELNEDRERLNQIRAEES